jgi:hypothetical protein
MSILTIGEKKALRTYSDNMTWFRAHYAKLTRDYSGKYVAIDNGTVLDSDTDPRRLIERLRSNFGGDRITTFAIELVSKNEIDIII